jgi:hypothetical protein
MKAQTSPGVIAAALAGVAVLILAAGAFLVVLPQRSHLQRINSSVATEKAQLTEDRAARRTPSSPVVVDAADLFRLSEAMPSTDRMPEILVDLSTLARQSRVTLTSVRPSADVPLTGYSAIPIAIAVNGKYANVTTFTRRIRDAVQMPHGKLFVDGRLFVVNQIQLSSSDGRTVAANINLDAFDYVPTPVTAPGTSGAAATTTTTSTTAGGTT